MADLKWADMTPEQQLQAEKDYTYSQRILDSSPDGQEITDKDWEEMKKHWEIDNACDVCQRTDCICPEDV